MTRNHAYDGIHPEKYQPDKHATMLNKMGYFVQAVNRRLSATAGSSTKEMNAVSFLYDGSGNRKYLTVSERTAFLKAASSMPPEVKTFCLTLAYTGARISEVLALTPSRIDTELGCLVLQSLKKRRSGVFRAVPVPASFIAELEAVHGIKKKGDCPIPGQESLWPWCRTVGWQRVKEAMAQGGVVGPQASPKGLRHAFAVSALHSGVPITFVRKWLGHARLSTTEIYAQAVGPEERIIANRLWESF